MQIGVDIGGTFTDIVALDPTGRLALTKVSSTPKELLDGIAAATAQVLALAGAAPGDVERFVHGTTVATNAILEQKGATTGILTTEGFEDVLEIGRRSARACTTSTWTRRCRPSSLRAGAGSASASAWTPGARARAAARGRRAAGGGDRCARRASRPSRSATFLVPQSRRTSGGRARSSRELAPDDQRLALVGGRPDLSRVRAILRDRVRRLPRPGGEALPRGARRDAARPRDARRAADHALARRHRLGRARRPAAGHAASSPGRRAASSAPRSRPSAPDVRDFVSLDMGGTSNDVALVRGGRAAHRQRGRASGRIPVRTPMVDVNTIGAGGGSIAWIDAGGRPARGAAERGRRARARPATAAAATRPTVTDANVVLGYLNPARFAGGPMTLDVGAAGTAVAASAPRSGSMR